MRPWRIAVHNLFTLTTPASFSYIMQKMRSCTCIWLFYNRLSGKVGSTLSILPYTVISNPEILLRFAFFSELLQAKPALSGE